MKIRNLSILLFLSAALFHSCEEDNDIDKNPNNSSSLLSNSDYLPDADSNIWIYEVTRIDTLNNSTLLGYDTMLVSSETINGKTYKSYKFRYIPTVPRFDYIYMRDSMGSKVNELGKIVFDISALNTVVRRDTIAGKLYYKYTMLKNQIPVTVPLGTFSDVMNYQTIFNYDSTIQPVNYPLQRVWDRMYAKNVGLIYESIGYTAVPEYEIERKLISFQFAN